MDLENCYPRKLYCEECKDITDHLITLKSANDQRVIFFKSCDECYKKFTKQKRNDMYFWSIERIPLKEWNALISQEIYSPKT